MTKQDNITAASGLFNEDLQMIRNQLRRQGTPRRAAPDG
jgi:acyl-CoA dehydrogenase